MNIQTHGLSIGMERTDNELFLMIKATSKLMHSDYQTITPMIESALAGIKKPQIKAFVDATDLKGWEARAAWDDFKLGLKHGNQFTHIAITGNKKWLEISAHLGNWFISGKVKYFENKSDAWQWLNNQ